MIGGESEADPIYGSSVASAIMAEDTIQWNSIGDSKWDAAGNDISYQQGEVHIGNINPYVDDGEGPLKINYTSNGGGGIVLRNYLSNKNTSINYKNDTLVTLTVGVSGSQRIVDGYGKNIAKFMTAKDTNTEIYPGGMAIGHASNSAPINFYDNGHEIARFENGTFRIGDLTNTSQNSKIRIFHNDALGYPIATLNTNENGQAGMVNWIYNSSTDQTEGWCKFTTYGKGWAGNKFGVPLAKATEIYSNRGAGHLLIGSGSDDQTHIVFGTNDIERMIIKHDGSIGIGTLTTPEKLTISGNVMANDFIKPWTYFPANATEYTLTTEDVSNGIIVMTDGYWAGTVTLPATATNGQELEIICDASFNSVISMTNTNLSSDKTLTGSSGCAKFRYYGNKWWYMGGTD